MRSSPKFWFVVSVLALFGAAVFWRLGEQRLRHARPPQAPAPAAVAPAAGAAATSGLVRLGSPGDPAPLLLASSGSGRLSQPPAERPAPADPAAAFDRQQARVEGLRLRNTALGLDQLAREDHAILLRNALLDSRAPLPAIPPHLRAAAEPGAFIVQARGPVDQSLRELLAVAGAEIVSYIPNNAYLVKAGAAQAAQVARSPRVAAVLPFEPWYKLEDSLLRLALDQQPLDAGAELNVVLLPGVEAAAEAALAAAGAEVLARSRTPFGPQWSLRAPPDSLPALARLPEVQTIEPRRVRVLLNDLTRQILGVSLTATNPPLQGTNHLGLTGSNVWINVNDTGVDQTHPDLAGRVSANDPSTLADFEGHGTHVAGTIAGAGAQSATITNLPGSVAPGADLRGQAPAAELYALPIDLQTGPLISDAYLQENAATNYYLIRGRRGVPISNNSWGYRGAYEYDTAAASYDAAVRDALDQVSGPQPILYVFAAGNDGFGADNGQDGEPGSISSPATAKNVITVGATELFRNITNATILTNAVTGEVTTNFWFLGDTDSNDEVTSFSSRGNVGLGIESRFGRFKPDVVAPGSMIASARSRDWIDPDRFYTSLVGLYRDQLVQPTAVNNYYLFVPDAAESFRIRLLPGARSPSPFPGIPLSLAYNRLPGAGDLIGTANIAEVPPDRPFRTGDWFFSVGNPLDDPLYFNILTVVTLTNELGPYFEELKRLNDGLAPSYRFESGTSMAAPAVAGFLGLMQEWFQRENRPSSPALLKALLINGSRSLGPLYHFHTRPAINYQGWGRPNLTNTLPAGEFGRAGDSGLPVQYLDQSASNALATGESRTWLVDVAPGARDQILKFTLVWTDPPGNPNAAIKLVNDLDLIVTNLSTREVFVGNEIPFRSDFNVAHTNLANATNDFVNNVENVLLRPPLGTNYSVTVLARRVNVNAVAAHPRAVVQDFALAVSVDNPSLTNVLNVRPLGPGLREPVQLTVTSNGVPLLYQRTSANSPLIGGRAGEPQQWHFYRFQNSPEFTPDGMGLTNGSNVAFITFFPPNVAVPRFRDADVDMYVSKDARLTNLEPAVLEAAFKSTNRGGTELVFFTNSVIGDVFYIGVKAEDQQGGEYGFVSLSSNLPFTEEDEFGNRLVRGLPVNVPIPDGSPREPGPAFIFGVSTAPITVADVIVTNTVAFDSTGDILLNLSHEDQFVVLQNSALDESGIGLTNVTTVYDDSLSGKTTGRGFVSRRTDGPGSLQNFRGMQGAGVWLMTATDNAVLQGATNVSLYLRLSPQPEDEGLGIAVTLLPGQWEYYFVDVPALATNLTVIVSALNPQLPVDVYIKRGGLPSPSDHDKFARISPPGGTLSLGTRDVPPLNPGRYFIGVFNPNSETLNFRLQVTLDLDLAVSNQGAFGSQGAPVLRDDGRFVSRIFVPVDRLISEINVGLRVDHPRVSDLVFHLVSPQGIRLLLAENRGGEDGRAYGADFGTNRIYTTFTDDTNRTLRPIKFGTAPFIESFQPGGGRDTVVMQDGFERGAAGVFDQPGFFSAGWFLRTGVVEVVRSPGQAFQGSQHLSFRNSDSPAGTLFFTNLFLAPDTQYRLNFAYAPDPLAAAAGQVQQLAVQMNGTNLLQLFVPPNLAAGWYPTSVVFLAEVDVNRLEIAAPAPAAAPLANPGFDRPVAGHAPLLFGPGQAPPDFGWRVLAGTVEIFPADFMPGVSGQALHLRGTASAGGTTIEQTVRIASAGEYQISFDLGASPVPFVANPRHRVRVFWGPTNGPLANLGFVRAFRAPQPPNPPPWDAGWDRNRSFTPVVRVTAPGDYILRFVSEDPGLAGPMLDNVEVRSLRGPAAPALDAFTLETITPPSVAYYLPEEPLRPVVGSRALGDWTLEVTDTRAGPSGNDTGRLLDWRLEMIFALPNVNAVRLTNGVPYFGRISGNETLYFIVEAPRCSTESINLVAGPFASLVLWGDRDGLPLAQFGQFADDYGPYLNVGPGGIASFTLTTNSPPAAPLRPGQRYYLALRNLADDQVNDFVIFVDFDCRDDDLAGIPLLTSGVPRDGTIRPGSRLDYYQFNVSPRAVRATFELIPRNGNVDLFVKRYRPGDPQPFPNPNSFDYRSVNPGLAVETIVVDRFSDPPLRPGPWLLGVLNMENAVLDYTVVATEQLAQVIPLENGVTYTNRIEPGAGFDYYEFTVSGGAVRAEFETLDQDGDINLYVRRGLPLPTPADTDFASLNPGTEPELIVVRNTDAPVWLGPGEWYLGVENAAGRPVNYGIRATEFPGIVVPLTNAVAYTNLIGPGVEPQYYSFTVSTNAIQAVFEVFDLSDDVDLLLRQGLPLPTLNDHHYASTNRGLADEVILLTPNSFPTPLAPGEWHLSVINRSTNAAAYAVRATETTEVITPLENGVPRADFLEAGARLNYYSFEVSTNAAAVTFETTFMSGDVDLFVRRGLPLPNALNAEYAGTNSGRTNEFISVDAASLPPLAPGTWFLSVSNKTSDRVSYEILAREITVAPPATNIVVDIVVTNGQVCLTWNSIPGTNYFVVAKINVDDPEWSPVSPTITAADTTATYCLAADPWRFFDVLFGEAPAAPVPDLVFSDIAVVGANVCLTWPTAPGTSYYVEGKADVTSPAWSLVPPGTLLATGTNLTLCVPLDLGFTVFRLQLGAAPPPPAPRELAPGEYELDVLVNRICLRWFGRPGVLYQVEGSDFVSPPAWRPASDVIVGAGADIQLCYTLGGPGLAFLRIIENAAPPAPGAGGQPVTVTDVGFDPATASLCLTWPGVPGFEYVVEGKPALAEPRWTPLTGRLPATGPAATYCVPLAQTDARYFRVMRHPASAPPPIELAAEIAGGAVRLTWEAPTGMRFRVFHSAALPPVWTPFPQVVESVNGRCEFVDDGSFTGGFGAARFYRVELAP